MPINEKGRMETSQAVVNATTAISSDGTAVFKVSSITSGGTLTLDGDASNNRVSAFQTDA